MDIQIHSLALPAGTHWLTYDGNHDIVAAVPPGLEGACAGIARRDHALYLKPFATGFIRGKRNNKNKNLNAILHQPPIWSFGTFLKLVSFALDSRTEAVPYTTDEIELALKEAIRALSLEGSCYWLWCPKEEPRQSHSIKNKILAMDDLALINDPTNYTLTIRITTFDNATHILLGPSISVRERFSYRKEDVGASINPVLAACLARLMPQNLDGPVIDPTCGSGTLLIERMAYTGAETGIGIDISDTAGKAFAQNAAASGLSSKIRFHLGSALDLANWQPCTSVIANLPFGLRIRQPREELEDLYAGIIARASEHLENTGRILLTSSFKSGLELAAKRNEAIFQLLSKYRAEMGGIHYQILVGKKRD